MDASGQDSKGFGGFGTTAKGILSAITSLLAHLLRGRRALELATICALGGAILLIASEFLDLFRVEDLRGNTIDSSTAGSNHGYALLIIAVVAIGAIFLARFSQQWLPAAGAATLGALALVMVLAGDLPDTTSSGLTGGRLAGDAHPALGFWLELIAALTVSASCAAIAWVLWDERGDPEREPTGVP